MTELRRIFADFNIPSIKKERENAQYRLNGARSSQDRNSEHREELMIEALDREKSILTERRDHLRRNRIPAAEEQVSRLKTALSAARSDLAALYNEMRQLEGADETNS